MSTAKKEISEVIDYTEWSKEYEQEAEAIARKIEILTQQLNSKISATEKLQINSRLQRLNTLLVTHKHTAKLLKERGIDNG